MHAPDPPTAAFAVHANSETTTLILRWCGPYWLFCTDTEPHVRRFLGIRFLSAIFAALECLISPGETSTGAIITWSQNIPEDIFDIEEYTPEHQRDWRQVCKKDLDSLSPGKCLNNIIINEYISNIPRRSMPVTIFNTFFCELLRKDPAEIIEKFDPYHNRFSLIPVYEGCHWFLVVLYNMDSWIDTSGAKDSSQRLFIAVLDSLEGSCQQENVMLIVEYLETEAIQRTNSPHTLKTRIITAKVPQQRNAFDCGVFLLNFTETFLSDPDRYCRVLHENTDVAAWEDNEPAISDMRAHVREVIRKLYDMTPINEPAACNPATVPPEPTDSRVIETRSKKGKEKAMPEVVISPPVKRPASVYAESRPAKRTKTKKSAVDTVGDTDPPKMVEAFWKMIDRARRQVGASKAEDSTSSTRSLPCNTLETLVKRATLSDNNVKIVNNTNLICYLKLGREINSMALTMGDDIPFRTKAKRLVDKI
ncbi:hypothetical protein BC938DRAFT_479849, partial [Jimgerdemannia flammicorona]